MAGQSYYINVLRGPSGPLSLTVRVKSSNNRTVLSLSTTINFNAKTDEKSAAEIIGAALNDLFSDNEVSYGLFPNGSAQFETTLGFYEVRPRAWVCDHYVNVWAQAAFRIELDAPVSTAADAAQQSTMIAVVTPGPVYFTLPEADALARIENFSWRSNFGAGDIFSETDKINLMIRASDDLRSLMGWSLTASQYICESPNVDNGSFFLDYAPIITWDYPAFGSPDPGRIASNLMGVLTYPEIDSETGFVALGPSYFTLPRCIGLKMGYVGGYAQIDSIFKRASMQLLKLEQEPNRFSEMRGGSGIVKLIPAEKVREQITSRVTAFVGRR